MKSMNLKDAYVYMNEDNWESLTKENLKNDWNMLWPDKKDKAGEEKVEK